MRIVTINVNGIRSAAKKGLYRWLQALTNLGFMLLAAWQMSNRALALGRRSS